MVRLNKQTTVTGACVLTVDGKEEQVAYMNASIPVGGRVIQRKQRGSIERLCGIRQLCIWPYGNRGNKNSRIRGDARWQ